MYLLLVPINPTNNDSRYRFAPGAPVFATLDFARTYLEEGIDDHTFGPDVTIHEWIGEVRDGHLPIFAGDPLPADVLFLALPHRGAGCRDEHRPLLKLAEQAIGTGLPLDALAKGEQPEYEDWEIDDSNQNKMLSMVIRVADEVDAWEVDDADDYPPTAVEAAIEWVTAAEGLPEGNGYDSGDYYGEVHAAVFDGEVIGCYDNPFDAAEAIDERLSESRYGYPWAWNWAYYLGERSTNSPVVQAVKAAGYTVATQTATGYLFAGIDAGGLDFDSAYKAPLGAALSHLWYQLIDGAIPVGPAL